jgi:type IV pilus assembly protein PilM
MKVENLQNRKVLIFNVAICDYCGKEVNDEAAFCQFCGHNVTPWVLEEGETLHHGRYEIVQPLGEGGMASVYLAEDLNLDNTPCVIKVMTDDFKDSEERQYAIQKFKDEAVMLARLRHTNLPVVQNHFIEEGRYFLVMDYVEGDSLEDIIDEALEEDGLLDEETVINWGIQICDVLDYLHSRDPMIVHRDIKTANIMEQNDGTIKLLDFGIARIFNQKKTGTLVGTPGYAAPEQYLGKAYPQSDLFALGATLHRLLTGYDPTEKNDDEGGNLFVYPPLGDFRDDLTPGLEEIISTAMDLEVENRYISGKKFKEALLRLKEKPVAPRGAFASAVKENIIKFDDKSSERTDKLRDILGKSSKPAPEQKEKSPLFSPMLKIKSPLGLSVVKDRLSKITGLDIGTYEIKILQMDIDGNGCVYPRSIISKRTPENTVSRGIITDPATLGKAIRTIIKKEDNQEVIASIPSYCSAIRTLKIPATSPDKVPSVLNKDIRQLIPLPMDDSSIEFEVLSPSIAGDERNMKVRVTAVRKSALENLRKTLKIADLNSDMIVIESFVLSGLSEIMIQDEERKKNIAIINIGAEGTSLTLIRDSIPSQNVNFFSGGNKLTQAIMQAERLSYEKSEEVKKTRCDADIWAGKNQENLFQILMPHIKDWTTEILKAVRYFGPDYRLDKFESIIFTGGTIDMKNLGKHINSQLKIEADKFFFPESKELNLDKEIIAKKQTSFMCAMGLALSPVINLNFIKDDSEEKKKKGFLGGLFKW